MNNLSNENIGTPAPSRFAEQLRMMRESQNPALTCIPDLKQWMQYWNDDESDAVNLRNIRHWLSRVPRTN